MGKEGTGITKSIEIKKREDNLGLGSATAVEAISAAAPENWWHDAFSSSLVAFTSNIKVKTGKKKFKLKDKDKKERSADKETKKSKKRKSTDDSDGEGAEPLAATAASTTTTSSAAPSFDELFIATGGKRLGMRARAEQRGKIRRTEG